MSISSTCELNTEPIVARPSGKTTAFDLSLRFVIYP
jgi:hypothetical protein